MIALVLAAAGLVLGLLTSDKAGQGRTAKELRALQEERDLVQRELHTQAATVARSTRDTPRLARAIQCFQWDADFQRLRGDQVRGDRMAAAIPQRQGLIAHNVAEAAQAQARVDVHTARLRELDKRIARLQPPQVRETPGLVTLVRVCWQGWLAKRRKSMLY